jgi:hypothetical protein
MGSMQGELRKHEVLSWNPMKIVHIDEAFWESVGWKRFQTQPFSLTLRKTFSVCLW